MTKQDSHLHSHANPFLGPVSGSKSGAKLSSLQLDSLKTSCRTAKSDWFIANCWNCLQGWCSGNKWKIISFLLVLTALPVRHQLGKHCTQQNLWQLCVVLALSSLIDSSVLWVVCFACLWKHGLCLQAPHVLLSELIRSCGLDLDCLRIAILSSVHRVQFLHPSHNSFTVNKHDRRFPKNSHLRNLFQFLLQTSSVKWHSKLCCVLFSYRGYLLW